MPNDGEMRTLTLSGAWPRCRRLAAALAVAMLAVVSGSTEPSLAVAADRPQTVVELDRPLSLEELADALRGRPVKVLELQTSGAIEGGYSVGSSTSLDEAVETYREMGPIISRAVRPGDQAGAANEPKVTSITLSGNVDPRDLGPLASVIANRDEIPPRAADSPARYGGLPLAESEYRAAAHPSAAAARWAPYRGRTDTLNVNARLPRLIISRLRWSSPRSIAAFGARAYEHDFKLFNSRNSRSQHPFCVPGESNNFWAARDDVIWGSSFPSEAKGYFDTDASDSCKTVDFTIGLYHPKRLKPGVLYNTSVATRKGENKRSPYELIGQAMPKNCDRNPFCVGLPGRRGRDGQRLIGAGRGNAPECREWQKGRPSRRVTCR